MSDDTIPFALGELPERAPWWPLSPWATWSRIRTGRMAAIRDGRRIYVTVELLRRYLAEHVTRAGSQPGEPICEPRGPR